VKRICLPNRRRSGLWLARTSRGEASRAGRVAGTQALDGVASNDREQDSLRQSVRARAIQSGEWILNAFSEELKRGEHTLLDVQWEHVGFYADVVRLTAPVEERLGQAPSPPREALVPAVPVYVVNSLFLADCHRFLLSDAKGYELMHLVTGSKVDAKTRTLDRMEKVALASHSAIHAEADQHDLQRRLIEMSAWGLAMHGLFHAHPGQGSGATRPSGKDLATHERFERGGYPLVGAIFVRDGYVRFFSAGRPFTIRIFGTGVTQHEEHVFKIENPGRGVSYDTPEDGKRHIHSNSPAGEALRLHPESVA
jgi:hypothetical protein